jgi:hypothetical protein
VSKVDCLVTSLSIFIFEGGVGIFSNILPGSSFVF